MKKLLITITLFVALVGSVFAFPREYTIYDDTQLVEMFTADIEDLNAKLSKYDWIWEIEDEAEFDATYSLYKEEIESLNNQIKKVGKAIATTKAYHVKMRIKADMEDREWRNHIENNLTK